ncbi:hypothetical protein NDN01_14290 [Sphingomonas sp. QA11]|uniref:hypothetical protein n=1 Tax=Sphingomonas sp. QA11 TaxID=2950605 RepID=UPI00234B30BB|nr:hypothetical protein [Sphingomonas sp. QA11]WCM25237.1 hypothetical protein NDN01_14290 [Sphingomonas sp. QA11]
MQATGVLAMLVTIACFCVFLGVLVTMIASREAKKDALGQRIPPEQAKIVALVPFIVGVGLLAYSLYLRVVQ